LLKKMILIHNYGLAVFFFVITMFCWGSWSNTQKMAAKKWRFELFYWDFALGLLLTALFGAITLGSMGNEGRTFVQDLALAKPSSIIYALLGGLVWNAGNLLLVAAIAVAGMSVGFPIGGGIAWVLGILINMVLVFLDKGTLGGNPFLLIPGIILIITAIYLSMISFKRLSREQRRPSAKGILLSVAAGFLIAFFYGLVVKSLDNNYVTGGTGTLTPFSGVFFFALGAFITTPLFNGFFMRFPVEGERVFMADYFKGSLSTHLAGFIGGFIWMTGMSVSFMAAGAANPAISYALSNAAPVVAILWGVFVWKEFRGAPKGTNSLLASMFGMFVLALLLITLSNA
jgi:glucose uptake protein